MVISLIIEIIFKNSLKELKLAKYWDLITPFDYIINIFVTLPPAPFYIMLLNYLVVEFITIFANGVFYDSHYYLPEMKFHLPCIIS